MTASSEITVRRCRHCGKSIEHRRRQAKTCSDECRVAAHKAAKRSRRWNGTVLDVEDGYFEALDANRGYVDDWTRQRKTEIMLSRAQQILDEYRDHLPLTCRQIYYRMIGAYGYPKGKTFQRSLYRMLDLARRSGEIPFDHIRDDGIAGGGHWFSGIDEFLHHQRFYAETMSRDVQADQPVRLQVWCEAEGMVPQLMRIADPYSIPVYSCGGFNSLTAVRQIAESCVRDTTGPTHVLHLGDCDPSGLSIFQAVFEDVSEFVKADCRYPEQRFTAERVAITFDQINEHGLTPDPIETDDSRSRSWRERGLTDKVEIEALAPDVIARLLENAIKRHVNLHVVDAIRDLQAADRAVLISGVEAAELAIGPARKLEKLAQLVQRWRT